MPPMDREEHEALLLEMLNPEIERQRMTEILQVVRADYVGVHTDFENHTKESTRLKKDNDNLIVSNSQLFRQTGIIGENEKQKEEVTKKSFSEAITLEQIEKRG